MPVNWGQANDGQFDYLQSLQAIGNSQAQKLNTQRGQYAFDQQRTQDAARPQLFAQAQGGDFKGAQAGALAGNDLDAYKVIAGLDEDQRKQVKMHAQLIGGFAANLSTLPQGEARVAALRAAAPQLKAQGFTDEELAQADLSDNGLRGYIAAAGATDNALEAYYKSQQPITLADGSQEFGATPMGGGARPLVAENTKDIVPQKPVWDSERGGWVYPPSAGAPAGSITTLGGGGQPSSGGAKVSPSAAAVASVLSSSGIPAPVVAGFMGNFAVEGGYEGAKGDGGSASGIAQWHFDRAQNFERVIGKPVTEATPAEQAKFVAWEMQNPQAAGMTIAQRDAIMAAKTPEQAAELIDRFYERSSGRDRPRRISSATAYGSDVSAPQPQPGSNGGFVPVVPPKNKQYRILSPQEAQQRGLDASSRWQIGPNDQITALPSKGDKPLTESQGKASGYLERAVAAADTLNSIPKAPSPNEANAYLYGLSTTNPLRRNISPEAQRALSAQEAFVLAVLRQDSGAAINKEEVTSAMRIYFPQPGDSASTQADKRRQREAAIRGLRMAAGPGADNVRGSVAPGAGARGPVRVLKIERVQ